MDILQTIVSRKKEEVAEAKLTHPLELLKKSIYFDRVPLSLRHFLLHPSRTGIIAEFKRRSPSKGLINGTSAVEEVTMGYNLGGASGLSVLTDYEFFGGTANDLQEARRVNFCPILRKDFIIDPYQLFEAKAWGADVVLLIAACLSVAQTNELADAAHQLGLEVLLEIHDENELRYLSPSIDLVGVNNRNLKTFEVSLETSVRLAGQIAPAWFKISESGISTVDDIIYLRQYGFQGFLIGENFMKTINPAAAFAKFTEKLPPHQ